MHFVMWHRFGLSRDPRLSSVLYIYSLAPRGVWRLVFRGIVVTWCDCHTLLWYIILTEYLLLIGSASLLINYSYMRFSVVPKLPSQTKSSWYTLLKDIYRYMNKPWIRSLPPIMNLVWNKAGRQTTEWPDCAVYTRHWFTCQEDRDSSWHSVSCIRSSSSLVWLWEWYIYGLPDPADAVVRSSLRDIVHFLVADITCFFRSIEIANINSRYALPRTYTLTNHFGFFRWYLRAEVVYTLFR